MTAYFYPGKFIPHPHKSSYFFNKLSILISSFHQHLDLPSTSVLRFLFRLKFCTHIPSIRATHSARLRPLVLVSLILRYVTEEVAVLLFVRIFIPHYHVRSSHRIYPSVVLYTYKKRSMDFHEIWYWGLPACLTIKFFVVGQF